MLRKLPESKLIQSVTSQLASLPNHTSIYSAVLNIDITDLYIQCVHLNVHVYIDNIDITDIYRVYISMSINHLSPQTARK